MAEATFSVLICFRQASKIGQINWPSPASETLNSFCDRYPSHLCSNNCPLWKSGRSFMMVFQLFTTVQLRSQKNDKDLNAANIDIGSWEQLPEDRGLWKTGVRKGCRLAEDRMFAHARKLRQQRKEKAAATLISPTATYTCTKCNRDCHSRIGIYSHSCKCTALGIF
ncbi:hypothetical protein GQR58_025814 [Nymphon striatum]|nr:hypothetical protein GQR58_025814 [Nymphon striatum]